MYIAFKEGKKHASKNAPTADTIEAFNDCGYLIKDDEIIIDIDNIDKDIIKSIISRFNIKTQVVWTERGAHFYFAQPLQLLRFKDGFTALGINVEYKNSKNTPNGITVRRNGITRQIDNYGVRQPFNEIFSRLSKVDNTNNLIGLSEGEGRNVALHTHKTKLLNRGVKDYQQCLHFINNKLFDKPLDNEEFETVTRFEQFKADKDNIPLVADLIKDEKKIKKYNGKLYYFNGTCYQSDSDDLIHMVDSQYTRDLPADYTDKVIKKISYSTPMETNEHAIIKFKNGILTKGKFFEGDFDGFTPFYVDKIYNKDAEAVKEVDEYLNFITNNEDYRKLILEMMAYSFIVDSDLKKRFAKFFIITGKGQNGKGTLVAILTKILGDDNVSTQSFHKLGNERNKTAIYGKLANIDDDMLDKPIDQTIMKEIKNITTGDYTNIRYLYKESVDVRLTANLIGTSNHIIKSFEKSDSYQRRVVWLPMFKKLTYPHSFFDRLFRTEESIAYWLRLVIEAYERLYRNLRFTEPAIIKEFNENYHAENDNTIEYLEGLTLYDFLNVELSTVKREYEDWCEIQGYTPLNIRVLQEKLEERFNLTKARRRINSSQAWRYILKEEFKDQEIAHIEPIKEKFIEIIEVTEDVVNNLPFETDNLNLHIKKLEEEQINIDRLLKEAGVDIDKVIQELNLAKN